VAKATEEINKEWKWWRGRWEYLSTNPQWFYIKTKTKHCSSGSKM